MNLFWQNGYDATSLRDLTIGMGINRGSLYDTFTDKRKLFITTLKHYDEHRRLRILSKLETNEAPLNAIQKLFATWVELILDDPSCKGCFLTNTALEMASHDSEIDKIVAESQKQTEAFFSG